VNSIFVCLHDFFVSSLIILRSEGHESTAQGGRQKWTKLHWKMERWKRMTKEDGYCIEDEKDSFK
jgi:hypothetical protein